jgi:hypothetical protein
MDFCALLYSDNLSSTERIPFRRTIVGFPNDQDPPLALCMVQAGAVYGNVIM